MNKTIKLLIDEKSLEKDFDIFLSKKLKNLTRSNIIKNYTAENVKINELTIHSPSKKIKTKDIVDVKINTIKIRKTNSKEN